jgi:hypothetical protein
MLASASRNARSQHISNMSSGIALPGSLILQAVVCCWAHLGLVEALDATKMFTMQPNPSNEAKPQAPSTVHQAHFRWKALDQ